MDGRSGRRFDLIILCRKECLRRQRSSLLFLDQPGMMNVKRKACDEAGCSRAALAGGGDRGRRRCRHHHAAVQASVSIFAPHVSGAPKRWEKCGACRLLRDPRWRMCYYSGFDGRAEARTGGGCKASHVESTHNDPKHTSFSIHLTNTAVVLHLRALLS